MGAKTNHTALFLLITSIGISFLGSLPPGTTNVLTLQLASQSTVKALLFSGGCLMGEMLYVSLCIIMMKRILKFEWVMKMLEWISFSVLLALALVSFIAGARNVSSSVADVAEFVSLPFISGLVLMMINPVQIPFWLGWTTVLYERNVLQSKMKHQLTFVIGAGVGSLLASLLFILAGDFISRNLTTSGRIWHYVLGAFFLASAVFQLRQIILKRSMMVRSPRLPRIVESRQQF